LTATAALLIFVGSCAPPATIGVPDSVTIAVVPYLTLAPVYIAAAEGYFVQQGLEVEFVRLARNQELMTALARGEVDASVGMLTVNELSLALSGARLRMIAAMGEFAPGECTFGGLLARREHIESGALTDPERLRQLVLDTNDTIPFSYWVDEVVGPLGLSVDDFESVDLPSQASYAALLSGSVDLSLDSEPFLSRLLASGEVGMWAPAEEVVPGFVLSMLMFGPSMLDERPEVGERLTVALLQAIRQFNLGKTPRNLEILQSSLALDPELATTVCWPTMRDDARLDPAVFRGYQEWNVAHGLIDRVVADDELFDHRFIDYANAELGR